MNARDFLPPIAIAIARKILAGSGRKTYANYEAALADCTDPAYGSADVVEVVLRKTARYRDEISASGATRLTPANAFSLCGLLACAGPGETKVIDVGGACGAHYFLARALLPKSLRLRWVVVETPLMVERAAGVFASDELSFSADLESAISSMDGIDLLHTSGTLQVVDRPYELLARIASASARHLMFGRLGLTRGSRDVVAVHESWLSRNGPGPMPSGIQDRKVRYPYVCIRESVFHETVRKNYDIVMTVDDDSGLIPVDGEVLVGGGIFARLKSAHR
ncbi:MAG: methyltransferase, TIGR04325 family [Burkholderiales bacterium]